LSSGGLLLVGLLVESNEEEEITGEECTSENGGAFRASALSTVGDLGSISGSEKSVGSKVDDAEIDDELGDLASGEVLLPPDLVSNGSSGVVSVHENVDGQVENDGDPRDGSATVKLNVAQKSGVGVVEDVEELEGLLLRDQEEGVDELPVLEEVVDDVELLHARSPGSSVTDGAQKSLAQENRHELFEHTHQQQSGSSRKKDVVDQESGGSLDWLAVLHKVLSGENDSEVDNESSENLSVG